MKFFRPSPPKTTKSNANAKPTFGAARAAAMEQRLQKAKDERVKITRAQYASPDPLNLMYEKKGSLLDRKINRLKSEK